MSRARRSLLYWLALSPLVVVILFPFVVMLSTALKPPAEVVAFPPTWLPEAPRLANFTDMWTATGFGRALLNSILISAGSTLLCLVIAVPAAYAAARLPFRGKPAYRQFLLITQMLSPIVLVLGIFRLMAAMGLVDRPLALVLAYAAFNLAFAVWMLQSYFRTIPVELEEAAKLDGASTMQALLLVFLPLAAPAFGVTAIFVFIHAWNEFVLALTLLRDQANFTLTIQIFSQVGGRYQVAWELVMAATLLASVPVAIVFALLQRSLVKGLALGAVK